MRTLIVEDDSASRRLLQILLSPYGPCDLAPDGEAALRLLAECREQKQRYDLICLDIMMPGLSGREVLKKIREAEEVGGVRGLDRVKIVMTTALSDRENVFGAFREECDAYVTKPINRKTLMTELEKLGLLQPQAQAK